MVSTLEICASGNADNPASLARHQAVVRSDSFSAWESPQSHQSSRVRLAEARESKAREQPLVAPPDAPRGGRRRQVFLAVVGLIVVAVAATELPAWRATKVDLREAMAAE
jgi:hypothetical protein